MSNPKIEIKTEFAPMLNNIRTCVKLDKKSTIKELKRLMPTLTIGKYNRKHTIRLYKESEFIAIITF